LRGISKALRLRRLSTMNQDQSSDDVRRFVLEETKKRVAYLKYVRSQGRPIDEGQLTEFEEEIRAEEESLGKSPQDSTG
jgi:hypothetical protein